VIGLLDAEGQPVGESVDCGTVEIR
jgi:hypothetical protein